jgi:hypothetical protein
MWTSVTGSNGKVVVVVVVTDVGMVGNNMVVVVDVVVVVVPLGSDIPEGFGASAHTLFEQH